MTALGVHVIDWMHALFGRVAQVQARFAVRATGMEDTASAALRFESGLPATLTCLYAAPYTNRFAIHGSAARVAVEANAAESETLRPVVTVTQVDGRTERLEVPWVDSLALGLRRWADACRGHGAPAVDGADAARNVAVLEAIVRSAARDGAPVAPDYAGVWDRP
jgi:predicted dehydrogenase